MNAEIITVGTELLLGQIIDTNSVYISKRLAELGINVYYKTSVGDNLGRLISALDSASRRADLIILTGGLGPTVDDITRDAVSQFANEELEFNQKISDHIQALFTKRGMPMPENNRRQAYLPKKSFLLSNPNGTAPGFIMEQPVIIACMPGVPSEMRQMLENQLIPFLVQKKGLEKSVIYSKVLKIVGQSESFIDEKIKDWFEVSKNPSIGILALQDEIQIRITAKANSIDIAKKKIQDLKEKIISQIGDYVYGEDEETLEQKTAELFFEKKLTLSTAESCTSGLLAYRLTEIAGSSSFYIGGVNAYSNEVKMNLLNVNPDIIKKHGAVSEECARAMAENCAAVFKTDIAVSITGIAGPGGGSKEKPVGLVFIGLRVKEQLKVHKIIFPGNRESIRKRTANTALFLLLQELKKR